jgi:hypothetical protein
VVRLSRTPTAFCSKIQPNGALAISSTSRCDHGCCFHGKQSKGFWMKTANNCVPDLMLNVSRDKVQSLAPLHRPHIMIDCAYGCPCSGILPPVHPMPAVVKCH